MQLKTIEHSESVAIQYAVFGDLCYFTEHRHQGHERHSPSILPDNVFTSIQVIELFDHSRIRFFRIRTDEFHTLPQGERYSVEQLEIDWSVSGSPRTIKTAPAKCHPFVETVFGLN